MDRSEYIRQVLACLGRLTRREREAVRSEIDAHMEDHICGLLDLGYPPALAEERTLAFMGDPAEVGRELNKQYPTGWLVVKRAAAALTLALALGMLAPAWRLAGQAADNLWNRFYPLHQLDLSELSFQGWTTGGEWIALSPGVSAAEGVDLRQASDGVGLWVYQARLEHPAAEKTAAWLAVSLYSENPFRGFPSQPGELTTPDGRKIISSERSFGGPFLVGSEVTRGEELTFTYEQGGHSFTFTVPLPWEEAP